MEWSTDILLTYIYIHYIYTIYTIGLEKMEKEWRLPIRFASPLNRRGKKKSAISPTRIRVSTGKLSQLSQEPNFDGKRIPPKIGMAPISDSIVSVLYFEASPAKKENRKCTDMFLLDILTGFYCDIFQQICWQICWLENIFWYNLR